MSENMTAYVAENWLDSVTSSLTATTTVSDNCVIGDYSSPWSTYYPWVSPTYYWSSYPVEEKIRLKLSEVERLRDAAKDNPKLKKILKKFAPHIEIEVDFP